MKKPQTQGFSVLELLVAISLTGLLTTGSIKGYQNYNRFTLQQTDILDMQSELNIISYDIERAIYLAGYGLEARMAITGFAKDTLSIKLIDPDQHFCLQRTDTTTIRMYSTGLGFLKREAYCNGILAVNSISQFPFRGNFSFSYTDKKGAATLLSEEVRLVRLDMKNSRYRSCYKDTLYRNLSLSLTPRNLIL